MKRAEWPKSEEPKKMLYAMFKAKKCGRKFRLFGCACCRSVWRLLSDRRSCQRVEAAEAAADGLLSETQISAAYNAASAANPGGAFTTVNGVSQPYVDAAQAVPVTLLNFETPENAQRHASIVSHLTISAASLAEMQSHPAGAIADYAQTAAEAREKSQQADWLRCIFGNPFRPVAFAPGWRSATVSSLAEAIYTDRAFDRLPILADALEDAGCDNRDILDHCRQPGEHVRGCWVVDLVLGKE